MIESAHMTKEVRDGSYSVDLVVTGIGQLCTIHDPGRDDPEERASGRPSCSFSSFS